MSRSHLLSVYWTVIMSSNPDKEQKSICVVCAFCYYLLLLISERLDTLKSCYSQ